MERYDAREGVRAFTLAMNQVWSERFFLPDQRTVLLRTQLMGEELFELAHAFAAQNRVEMLDALLDLEYVTVGTMGAFGCFNLYEVEPEIMSRELLAPSPINQMTILCNLHMALGEVLLAIGGCLYAGMVHENHWLRLGRALGVFRMHIATALFGLGLTKYRDAGFAEVQRANMSKLGDDGKPVLNNAGRVVKGPNYQPPDLARVMAIVDAEILVEENGPV